MTKEERILSEIEIALDDMSEKERNDFLRKCGFVLKGDLKTSREQKIRPKGCGNRENAVLIRCRLKKSYN